MTRDAAKIDCTGRHTQSQMKSSTGLAFHAAVPDLTWPSPATPEETSLLCLKCHADSNVPASVSFSTRSNMGNHDPFNPAIRFNITARSVHETSNSSARMAWLTCHDTTAVPSPTIPTISTADVP